MTCLDQKSSCLQPDYHKTSHGSPGSREWRREDGKREKERGKRERESGVHSPDACCSTRLSIRPGCNWVNRETCLTRQPLTSWLMSMPSKVNKLVTERTLQLFHTSTNILPIHFETIKYNLDWDLILLYLL